MGTDNGGRLVGKVALITGGGRGIGRSVALAYARAGARVAVAARGEEEIARVAALIERDGGRAVAIRADVEVTDEVQLLVRRVESTLGPIDILVNDAARILPGGYAWEVDPDDWMRTINVNLGGAVRLCRAVVPGMVERRQGKVINVSSGAGLNVMQRWSAYCASKAALNHFTRCLAIEVKPFGVNVNAVSVYAETQLWWDQIRSGPQGGEHPQNLKRQAEAGSAPQAEENNAALLFLASAESDRVTGVFLEANGMAPASDSARPRQQSSAPEQSMRR